MRFLHYLLDFDKCSNRPSCNCYLGSVVVVTSNGLITVLSMLKCLFNLTSKGERK